MGSFAYKDQGKVAGGLQVGGVTVEAMDDAQALMHRGHVKATDKDTGFWTAPGVSGVVSSRSTTAIILNNLNN